MKLTWFGGTVLRIHIGGAIFVADAEGAPAGFDAAELLSGADGRFALGRDDPALDTIDVATWRPRRASGLDEGPAVALHRIGEGAVLVEAPGEPPLALLAGPAPRFGRWADGAVLVLFGGAGAVETGLAALQASRPRGIVLAMADADVGPVIAGLRDDLDGCGLMALEPALALEV